MLRDPESTPRDVALFVKADEALERGLVALSVAESLTDDLATYLLEAASVQQPEALIRGLHLCDFVVERNSEWRLATRARDYLLPRLAEHAELARNIHNRLLRLSDVPASRRDFSHLPSYLVQGPGVAYHASALSPAAGLPRYSELALSAPRGQQWLAAQLAKEQQRLGILPEDSIEIDFLQGMVLYREGKVLEAEHFLRVVAGADGDRIEIAVALHITGRLEARRGRARQAETMLNRSLTILRRLGDEFGQAQVLHTLGQLIGRDRRRARAAERLLRESLRIERQRGNGIGEMRVLHTLGQLIGRDRRQSGNAEALLRQSLSIGERLGLGRERQALHTLGQLIGRNPRRRKEAERLLEESLDIARESGDEASQAQVLHTLGRLLGRNPIRSVEAESLLRTSLEIGERRNDKRHQAQVLYSLGKLRARQNPDEALELLQRSLALNHEIDDAQNIKRVEEEINRIQDV